MKMQPTLPTFSQLLTSTGSAASIPMDEQMPMDMPMGNMPMDEQMHMAMPMQMQTDPPLQGKVWAPARNGVGVRKDEASLSAAEQEAFKAAVTQLVQNGSYRDIVNLHANGMNYRVHARMAFTGPIDAIGFYRFLPWHRRFLLEMERMLQQIDAGITIPYWRWQNPFPVWLNDFLPATVPANSGNPPLQADSPPPPRVLGGRHPKPSAANIDQILNHFADQVPSVDNPNDYARFTMSLEGLGVDENGIPIPGHDNGHAWVGGIMDDLMLSPIDPVFWLHHSQVDRLWEIWQTNYPAPVPAPPITPPDSIMSPWTEAFTDLLDIKALGYSYDDLKP